MMNQEPVNYSKEAAETGQTQRQNESPLPNISWSVTDNPVPKRRGIKIILAAIIILLVCVASYWVVVKPKKPVKQTTPAAVKNQNPGTTQTTPNGLHPTSSAPADATGNSKIYRNDQYGFEIKYPAYTSLKEMQVKDIFSVTLQDEGPVDLSSPLLIIKINKSDYKTIGDYKSYLLNNECPQGVPANLCHKYNFTEITISGIPSISDDWKENGTKSVRFIKDGLLYEIAGKTLKNGFGVDQIVSNLTFTK